MRGGDIVDIPQRHLFMIRGNRGEDPFGVESTELDLRKRGIEA